MSPSVGLAELIILLVSIVLLGLIFLVSMLIGKIATKLTGRAQRSKVWGWRIFCVWSSLSIYIPAQRRLMLAESVGWSLAELAMILGSVFFVYWVFFRWVKYRTIGPSDFVKHHYPIIVCVLVFPILTLGLAIWMLPLLSIDQVSRNDLAPGTWIIFLLNVLAAVAVIWGFKGRKRWAKQVARVLSFWYAVVSIPGLFLAFYTWWATQTNGNVGKSDL